MQPSTVVSHYWLYGAAHDCKTKATRLHNPELVPSFKQMLTYPTISDCAVGSLDISVLLRFAWLDIFDADTVH